LARLPLLIPGCNFGECRRPLTVTVTAETANVDTTKTEVSQVVDDRRIDNLPINGRNYINFTLTNSQTTRDVAPTIGPAPTSGLSMGGIPAYQNLAVEYGRC
jgi:hypothetical protein